MTDANFKDRSTIPYGIPLRSCYSRNVRNLLTAGRPIGASYVAFASSRVLATGAIVGQGVGVAAALCKKYQCDPRTVAANHADELQQLLLRQDGFVPGVENTDPKDLAREAQVISSSEAALQFPESETYHPAHFPLGQLFPVSTKNIEGVQLLLESKARKPLQVSIGLRKAQHVWDFRPTHDVATAAATIPPGHKGYVSFPINARTQPGSLYFVHIDAHPEIGWAIFSEDHSEIEWPIFNEKDRAPSRIPVGTTAADRPPGSETWRPLTNGKSFCMRVEPEQRPYAARNVVSGTNRPDLWSNIFMSDPSQELPAWLELRLPSPVRFNQIQITFDTNVNRRIILPRFRYPECVKRYEIAIPQGNGWKVIVREEDNYARRRVHQVDSTFSDRLRINVHETNGSKEARIYEVRIYNENETKS